MLDQGDTIVFEKPAPTHEDGYSPLSENIAPAYDANTEFTVAAPVGEEPVLPPGEQVVGEQIAEAPKPKHARPVRLPE